MTACVLYTKYINYICSATYLKYPFHWLEDCLVFASMNYVVGPGYNEDMYHKTSDCAGAYLPTLYYSKLYLISICTKLYLMESLELKKEFQPEPQPQPGPVIE